MRQFYILVDWFLWNSTAIWITAGILFVITLICEQTKWKKITSIAQSITIIAILFGMGFGFFNTLTAPKCQGCNSTLHREEQYIRCPECRIRVDIPYQYTDIVCLPDVLCFEDRSDAHVKT